MISPLYGDTKYFIVIVISLYCRYLCTVKWHLSLFYFPFRLGHWLKSKSPKTMMENLNSLHLSTLNMRYLCPMPYKCWTGFVYLEDSSTYSSDLVRLFFLHNFEKHWYFFIVHLLSIPCVLSKQTQSFNKNVYKVYASSVVNVLVKHCTIYNMVYRNNVLYRLCLLQAAVILIRRAKVQQTLKTPVQQIHLVIVAEGIFVIF